MSPARTRRASTASLLAATAMLAVACAGSSSRGTSATTTTTPAGTTTVAAPTSHRPISNVTGSDLSLSEGSIAVRAAVPARANPIEGSLQTPDGRTRTYRLYVPSSLGGHPGDASPLPSGAVPLLVALHGGTGWGAQFERNSGFDGLAEANGFIVVYPDGVGTGADGTALRTWNGGDCCGAAARLRVDDVDFIRLLIASLRSHYDIDARRVFATGHSNGGILAYRLACELSDQIVAIGVQSSTLEIDACQPSHPVSVLQIHGSADQNIPIGGGTGPHTLSGVSFNRPIDAAKTLATVDGCPVAPTHSTDAHNPDLSISSWSPCAHDTEVAFVEVAGAPHAWMGHSTGGSGLVGVPYPKLDSSLVIWNFLSQHPRT